MVLLIILPPFIVFMLLGTIPLYFRPTRSFLPRLSLLLPSLGFLFFLNCHRFYLLPLYKRVFQNSRK